MHSRIPPSLELSRNRKQEQKDLRPHLLRAYLRLRKLGLIAYNHLTSGPPKQAHFATSFLPHPTVGMISIFFPTLHVKRRELLEHI